MVEERSLDAKVELTVLNKDGQIVNSHIQSCKLVRSSDNDCESIRFNEPVNVQDGQTLSVKLVHNIGNENLAIKAKNVAIMKVVGHCQYASWDGEFLTLDGYFGLETLRKLADILEENNV